MLKSPLSGHRTSLRVGCHRAAALEDGEVMLKKLPAKAEFRY